MEIIPFTPVFVGLQNCLRDWTLGICQRGLMHILLSFNGYSADFRSIKIRLSHCLFSHLWGLGSPALSERSQLLLLHTTFSGSFIWICTVTRQDLREGDFVDGDALLLWWSSWINIIFKKGSSLSDWKHFLYTYWLQQLRYIWKPLVYPQPHQKYIYC